MPKYIASYALCMLNKEQEMQYIAAIIEHCNFALFFIIISLIASIIFILSTATNAADVT